MANKTRVNISVTPDTAERLKQCAYERHTTVSQLITDWIWKEKVSGAQLRGQRSLELLQREKERAEMDSRIIVVLPEDYEEIPGPMCQKVAADMLDHAIARTNCDVTDLNEVEERMQEKYPDAQISEIDYSSAKWWGLVD